MSSSKNHFTVADRYASGAVNVNVGAPLVVSVSPWLVVDPSVKHAYRIVVCGGRSSARRPLEIGGTPSGVVDVYVTVIVVSGGTLGIGMATNPPKPCAEGS